MTQASFPTRRQRGRRPPDKDQVAEAVRLYEAGNTYKQVGEQLRVSESTAHRWVTNYVGPAPHPPQASFPTRRSAEADTRPGWTAYYCPAHKAWHLEKGIE